MKITIYWDRVFGLLAAIIAVFIAIFCYKVIYNSNQYDNQDIGQCDMHEAQKIIDNLVNFFLSIFPIIINILYFSVNYILLVK
jgi:hypothetical protein